MDKKWDDVKGFLKYLKKKKIFLFGAGIQGERMGKFIKDSDCIDNIVGYIDNNRSEEELSLDDKLIRIFSLEDASDYFDGDTIIIITAFSVHEIYNQLKDNDYYEKIEIYSYAELAREVFFRSDYSGVVNEYNYSVIPRKIHYVWVGGEKPINVVKNINTWKEKCPDFEIIEWNENNYDMNKVPYLREAYECKAYGYVPDYLRLDVIYKYGGIYLDADIELKRPLDDLLYQDCFGCVDSSLTLNLGSGFGARPGCEIIKEFRDYYNKLHFRYADDSIDKRSCNSHQYEVLRKKGYRISEKMQKIMEMNIYPAIFQGRDYLNGISRVTDKTYWIHWGNMSWFDGK